MLSERNLEIFARNANQLGNALLRFRKQRAWTQGVVGERAGVKQPIVSGVEAGASGTRLETLFKILAALDLELVVRKRRPSTDR